MTPLDDLLKQARWLHFKDPGLERVYRGEREAEGVIRARIMSAVAMLYMSYVGYNTAMRVVTWGGSMEILNWELTLRFFVVGPAWLVLFLSTFVGGPRRWAGWLYAAVTAVACAGLVARTWGPVVELQLTGEAAGAVLLTDFTLVLLITAVAVPMRVVHLVAAALASTVPVVLWMQATKLPRSELVANIASRNLLGVSVLVVAMAWLRERGHRTLYAQRVSLRQLNGELARLNAEKNEFMAVAAHDLRAPLGIVRGLLELVRDGKIATAEKRAEAVRQALGEAQRMHTLVDDYLGAHALESGTVPVRRERLDLGAAAQAAGVRHAGAAEKKGQRIDVEAPAGKVWVTADAGMLAQVADNFVTNARKFSAAGATVKIELLVAEAEGGGGVARLTVTDEGPGIAAEEQGRLFTKFGKGSARATAGEASTGLGLAVAKRLAEAMGGAVGCESPANERGTGATFWVEVALATEGAHETR